MARDGAGALGDEAEKIQGPYLSLRTLDHRQVQMVVSGRTPQDVADAVLACATTLRSSTGSIIQVDAGRHLS